MRTRRAWLQKHPTPAASGGEFHWYGDGDGANSDDRALQARFAERLAGQAAPAMLWEHAPGCVAWARTFAAVAPHDGRRYVGLALVVVDAAGAAPASLLAELDAPRGAPWPGDANEIGEVGGGLDVAVAARALLDGGERGGRRPRRRAAIAAIEARAAGAGHRHDTPRRVARRRAGRARRSRRRAVAAAVTAPRSRAATAWRALRELAAATGRDVDALARDAVAPAPRDRAWLDTLHRWGRGRGGAAAHDLADRAALRAIACLAAGRHPAPAIAEVRWHALLPARERAQLLAMIARRVPPVCTRGGAPCVTASDALSPSRLPCPCRCPRRRARATPARPTACRFTARSTTSARSSPRCCDRRRAARRMGALRRDRARAGRARGRDARRRGRDRGRRRRAARARRAARDGERRGPQARAAREGRVARARRPARRGSPVARRRSRPASASAIALARRARAAWSRRRARRRPIVVPPRSAADRAARDGARSHRGAGVVQWRGVALLVATIVLAAIATARARARPDEVIGRAPFVGVAVAQRRARGAARSGCGAAAARPRRATPSSARRARRRSSFTARPWPSPRPRPSRSATARRPTSASPASATTCSPRVTRDERGLVVTVACADTAMLLPVNASLRVAACTPAPLTIRAVAPTASRSRRRPRRRRARSRAPATRCASAAPTSPCPRSRRGTSRRRRPRSSPSPPTPPTAPPTRTARAVPGGCELDARRVRR